MFLNYLLPKNNARPILIADGALCGFVQEVLTVVLKRKKLRHSELYSLTKVNQQILGRFGEKTCSFEPRVSTQTTKLYCLPISFIDKNMALRISRN